MEYNEYAVHRCKVRFMQDIRDRSIQDESPLVDTQEVTVDLVIVAPKGDLGDDLIRIHLYRRYRFVNRRIGAQTHILVSHTQENLDAVIQYDDRYRGQL